MQTLIPCKAKAASKPSPAIVRTALLVLFLASGLIGHAQTNLLNRKVTLRLNNIRLDEALDRIGEKGGFSFSYNADLLPTDSLVNVQARREAVKDVLETLLGRRMVYRPIGNHLVIRRRVEAPLPYTPPPSYQLEGFLIDGVSGDQVHFGTVFESHKRTSTLTDGQGHYSLEIPGDARQVALSFSKRGYRDTVIVIRPDREQSLTVGLMPIPGWDQPVASRPVSLVGDRDDDLPFIEFLVPQEQRSLARNIQSALVDFPIQISLVPAIGTNKLLSGGMDNHFSLNLLGGYAYGVRGVEIGGLFNIDRDHVYGVQVGGLMNIVGGQTAGVQVGGLFNHVAASMKGVQVGGLYNLVKDSVLGVQVGGVFNRTQGKVTGLQVGGVYNSAGKGVDGGQIAGVVNISKGNVRAMQVGGVANVADSVGLFQIAGVTNVARGDVKGFQIAGVNNQAAHRVSGFQISGLYNKAKRVDGIQIGLVNVADTVGGVQIGLININKTGYTAFELSTNEVTQANLSYKAGNRRLFSIISLGLRFNAGSPAWSYGAGIGTLWDMGPLTLGLDLTCHQVNEEEVGPDRLNLLIPGRVNLGLKLGRALELYGGASLNLHLSGGYNHSTDEFVTDIGWNPFWVDENAVPLIQSWVGYQAGLRVNLRGGGFSEAQKERKEKRKREKAEEGEE